MMKLDGVAAFVAIAQEGSISAASRRLGHAKSVISERLGELESTLGTRLMQRTTRKLSLTEDGLTFLPRAQRILLEASEAAAELIERRGSLAGPLRLSAPVGFGVLHLGPVLYAFLAEHPAIELTLDLDDRFVDAAAAGFDAVIRHGPIADKRLVAQPLARSRRVLVASPAYLACHPQPQSPNDLETHRGIVYSNREADWRFAGPSGWAVVRPHARLRVNNGLVMRDAAIAGLGIALLPAFFVDAALRIGALVAFEIGFEAEGGEISIAYPRGRSTSAKIVALTEKLKTAFGNPLCWDTAVAVP